MWIPVVLIFGLLVNRGAWTSELSWDQAIKPDAYITVSVKPDEIHWKDVQLPLWRDAVNAGYQQLEDWLRERHQKTQQPIGSKDYLSRLPRELQQYIANKCGTTGKSLYVLSLVNTRLLFALLPILRKRHWAHEVAWLSRFRIKDNVRFYTLENAKTVFKIVETDVFLAFMHKGLYTVLADFSQQRCYYQQRSSIRDWDIRYNGPMLLDLRSHGLERPVSLRWKELLSPFPPVNLHLFKKMDLDLWGLRVLAPHLTKEGVVLESLSLHQLSWDHVSQRVIPKALGQLTTLTELEIRTELLSLPQNVGALTCLEKLTLSKVTADGLETILPKLTRLTFLNLTSIPDISKNVLYGVATLRNLKTLKLQCLKLRKLPKKLCRMASLEELSLGCNLLKKLPNAISELTSLQYLDVISNQLRDLPANLFTIPSLGKVRASRNDIQYLCVETLCAHRKLREKAGLPPLDLNLEDNDNLSYLVRFQLFWHEIT